MKILALILTLVASTAQAQTLLTPADFTLAGTRDVHFGGDTPYMAALTHRYVGGELRFLTLKFGELIEFRPNGYGQMTGEANITARWANLPGLSAHNGIWYEASRNRLWVTSSQDYTNETVPAHITTMTLGADGTVSNVHRVNLSGVNEKRMYGGCQPSPVPAHAYVCGWGGYTSLVEQGGGASQGPAMLGIADPTTYANGATIPATVILNTTARGVRKTLPLNYYDGGDTDAAGNRRENPQTRPSRAPWPTAGYLSPNSDGLGWFVWGDSYYNTGAWIDTGDKRGFVMVASLCGVPGQTQTTVGVTVPGAGACWYQGSTLNHDGRTAELHIFNPAQLGTSTTLRPSSMVELTLPRGVPANATWSGNVPQLNVSGATYDATTKLYHLIVYPMANWSDGRLYSFAVAGTGVVTPPPPPPAPVATDAVVSAWSAWDGGAWSDCAAGTQTRTETRTRTVITPASNGGTTPTLSETRTASQTCTVTPPPPPPPPTETITHADLKAILDRIEAALEAEPMVTFPVTVTSIGSSYANGDRRLTIRVPLASMPTAPTNGSTLRVVKD